MLGIRRYKGLAIDLFQGDHGTFVCDLSLPLVDAQSCAKGLKDGDQRRLRHVIFHSIMLAPFGNSAEQAAEQALSAVKGFADSARVGKGVGRVTFVLASAEHYHIFQETLFRLFPEEDD